MSSKPRLSFWQIWNMSFGFLGIQFGFALQNANTSRIFETLGASVEDIPILWIAAPVTGLIVQPIIGHMSDKTWCKLGRRRPYFLFGAIFASLALIVMPLSPALWVAAGMLWIMDASINISMEPFRAFVGDMLPDEQRTRGFAMQSFFIGIGAFVASYLPYVLTNWFGIENTAPDGEIALSVQISFFAGAAMFFGAVAWTVFSSKEYPPELLEEYQRQEHAEMELAEEAVSSNPDEYLGRFQKIGLLSLLVGLILSAPIYYYGWSAELYIVSLGIAAFGLIQLISAYLTKIKKADNGFVHVQIDLLNMPTTMKQLAVVQFFSWFALFSMWIYTTAAVTSHIYGTEDTATQLYNDGADWVGVMFAWYNAFAAAFAFLLPVLAKHTSRKITHMIALIAGGVGLISIYFISNPDLLIVSMLGVGLAWASILSMPYAILTGALPVRKMGVYMGIFNFFIVIPQMLAASILGFLTHSLFHGEPIYTLIAGGCSMIIAAFSVLFVNDKLDKK